MYQSSDDAPEFGDLPLKTGVGAMNRSRIHSPCSSPPSQTMQTKLSCPPVLDRLGGKAASIAS
eukprot:10899043-Karenia_brevis.AAC.1